MTMKANFKGPVTAILDDAHAGNIQGAFGKSSTATSRRAKPGSTA
jgi:hypothetical protein